MKLSTLIFGTLVTMVAAKNHGPDYSAPKDCGKIKQLIDSCALVNFNPSPS